MVRGDKNPLAEVSSPTSSEGEEIDRIMQEIEDLEKKMDTPPAESTEAAPVAETTDESGKVVALRPSQNTMSESLAETDAVPAVDEPLMKDGNEAAVGDGSLAMKVGGCSEISLEFTRAGVTVTLACGEEGLSITTDQGAEFRIPFKRAA